MKLIHLSDLHLGKKLNDISLKEDQDYILEKILEIIDRKEPDGVQPDGVMIAGDVYDSKEPSTEAVSQWDHFLYELDRRKVMVFVISGNHDSAERLACNGRLLRDRGINIAPNLRGMLDPENGWLDPDTGRIRPVTCRDEYGLVNIYLLPFIRPADVRNTIPEQEKKDQIRTYTDGVRYVVENYMSVNPSERNVLIAHQFVTGAVKVKGGSESVTVGGLDNVDASAFDCFDYVALGHIHGCQSVGRDTIRYCGTPLKYSFAEMNQKKSVTVVELGEKGTVKHKEIVLTPKRDMVQLCDTFDHLAVESRKNDNDFVYITLKDREYIANAANDLRENYFRNLVELRYEEIGEKENAMEEASEEAVAQKDPLAYLQIFYQEITGEEMSGDQMDFAAGLKDEIWGEEE